MGRRATANVHGLCQTATRCTAAHVCMRRQIRRTEACPPTSTGEREPIDKVTTDPEDRTPRMYKNIFLGIWTTKAFPVAYLRPAPPDARSGSSSPADRVVGHMWLLADRKRRAERRPPTGRLRGWRTRKTTARSGISRRLCGTGLIKLKTCCIRPVVRRDSRPRKVPQKRRLPPGNKRKHHHHHPPPSPPPIPLPASTHHRRHACLLRRCPATIKV